MILTTCPACAAPLAHDAPRCVRCKLSGDGHDLTFGLHVYYAKSIFLCHFLGGDDYRGDYQRALELLEALGARAVAQFGEESQYTEDLVDFVNYARNNRLE